MNYLQLTNDDITNMKQNEFNLIIARTGSGKTTAIIRDLGAYCEANNKSMLYLVPRKSLEEQLKYQYHDISDKVIQFHTYQWLGTYFKHGFDKHYDYIILDECHTLLTNSTYDFSCYKIIEYINATTDVFFVGLTATPQPFYYLINQNHFKKALNSDLKIQTYDNSTAGDIYLVRNKANLFKMHDKALQKDYKVISFTNATDDLNAFKKAYKGYKCACILSKYNENAKKYTTRYDKDTYIEIVEKSTISVQHVTTTTVFEFGVSIKQDDNFLVSFEGNYMPHTIEQCKSRIRATDSNSVDMLFQIKTKKSAHKKLVECTEKLAEFHDMYRKYMFFKVILTQQSQAEDDNYERFNPVARSFYEYQLSFYKRQYAAESQEQFYVDMLKEMYPNKRIVVLENKDIFDVAALIEKYMINDIAALEKDDLKAFKEELKCLKLDKKNPNRNVGLSNFKKYLVESELPFEITSKSTKNGTKWIIFKKILNFTTN